MGSLNTFYLMGRVARLAEAAGQRHGRPVVVFGLSTGAQGREPIMLEAAGPQAEQAKLLRMNQGVFVRGSLRVDTDEGGRATLVAQVQALDAVIDGARLRARSPRDGAPAAEGEGGAPGEGAGAVGGEGQPDDEAPVEGAEGEGARPRRRPRRRRGRRRPEGASGEGGAPAVGAAEARPARPELPPPAPIAPPPQPVQPKPDPTYRTDMPF